MLKQKAYYLLFFFAFVLAVLSFFQTRETMTLSFKDTYYVIQYKQFYMLLAFLLALAFLAYQLLEKLKVALQNRITLLHVYGTLLSVLSVLYLNYKNAQPITVNHIQISTGHNAYNGYLIIALVVLSLVQLFLIMNIFVTVVKKFLPTRY